MAGLLHLQFTNRYIALKNITMYNYGLQRFMQAKSLSSKEAIGAFLESEGITEFTHVNHNRVNNYIQNNWQKFCSFIDKSIKIGAIKGQAVKLNYAYDEARERNNEIRKEFEEINLSKDELKIINLERHEFGPVQSFIAKKGLKCPAHDYNYTSKKLQKMPYILLLRENNLMEELTQIINNQQL